MSRAFSLSPMTATPIAIAVFTLLMIGCSKQETQEAMVASGADSSALVNCDDASIKNGLVRALSDKLETTMTDAVATYSDASTLQLESRTQQRLKDIAIDLQNAHLENALCQAQAIIILPMTDVQNANHHYATIADPSVAERAISQNVTLGADTRFIAPISYQVIDGTVSLQDKSPLPALIADILAASAYTTAKSEITVNAPQQSATTASEPAITSTVQPRTPAIIEMLDTISPTDDNEFTPTPQATISPPDAIQSDNEILIIELDETY